MFKALDNIERPYPITFFNTGTMYDLLSGSVTQGVNGEYLIKGGIANAPIGIGGRTNTYKSTFANDLMIRALKNYPGTMLIINETEGSYDEQRILDLSGTKELPGLKFISGCIYGMESIFEILKDIGNEKQKRRKAFTAVTPFEDVVTGEAAKCWIPTFGNIDSFSMMSSEEEDSMIEKGGLRDKKNKTVFILDGNKKTIFIRNMRKRCERHGIALMLLSHIGENSSISDTEKYPTKQMPSMKPKDKNKHCGPLYNFLTKNFCQVSSATLQSADKTAMYKLGSTPPKDLHTLSLIVHRGKNGGSDISFPFVVSQTYGLLNTTTHFNYLREYGNHFGLTSSQGSNCTTPSNSVFLPDIKLFRHTIRKVGNENYQVARALELSARYYFIKTYWDISKIGLNFSQSMEVIVEKIKKSKTLTMDEVLNSESIWRYDRTDKHRKYLSIFDIIKAIEGEK